MVKVSLNSARDSVRKRGTGGWGGEGGVGRWAMKKKAGVRGKGRDFFEGGEGCRRWRSRLNLFFVFLLIGLLTCMCVHAYAHIRRLRRTHAHTHIHTHTHTNTHTHGALPACPPSPPPLWLARSVSAAAKGCGDEPRYRHGFFLFNFHFF